MASDKALYWMAVIVITLGLGNSFATAHPEWVQAVAERPLVLADATCSRISNLASVANLMFGRSQVGVARTQVAVDRVQSRLASVQARIASRQAEMASQQAQRVRTITIERINRTALICPPKDTDRDAPDAPVIQIDDSDTN
jgi:hypothetical protein